MSEDPRDRITRQEEAILFKQANMEDNYLMSISSLIDNIHLRNINNFYSKEESLLKTRIDKLNYKFYLETENYLDNNGDKSKCQDKLFIILFKQISLYLEEIERLNKIVKENTKANFSPKSEEFNKKDKENFSSRHTIRILKNQIKQWEKKNADHLINEDKMRKEIDSIKRQLTFHNDKLQFDITLRKAEEMKKKAMKTSSKSKLAVDKNNNSFQTKNNSKEVLSTKDNEQSEKTDNSVLDKILNKKRNYSDNNPTCQSNPTSSSKLILKKRYKNKNKEGVEVNNININLNLHLKNSNNANINVNNINSPMIDNSEIDKSSKIKKIFDNKSPSRLKYNNIQYKGKADFSQKNSAKKDQVSLCAKATGIKQDNFAKKNVINTVIQLQDKYQAPTTKYDGLLDLTATQELLTSHFNQCEEEVEDLEELESLLILTKQGLISASNDALLTPKEDVKNYPLSDNEENSSDMLNYRSKHALVESVNYSNTSNIAVQQFKKTYPPLTWVTIDLVKKQNKNTGSIPNNYSKNNLKRSDSVRSDFQTQVLRMKNKK